MNRTVTALVKGGLGNQLFCYAAARALALRCGRDLLLDARTGFRRDGYGRSYRLDRLPTAGREAPPELRLGDDPRSLRHRLARAINRLLPPDRRWYLAEDPAAGPAQLTALEPRRRHLYLNGYWQDEGYFSDHAGTIRRELTPPQPADPAGRETAARIAGCESVAVHVRRVRYSPRLDAACYRAAIDRLRDELADPRFFLFGDDPGWARSGLGLAQAEATTVDHNPDDELADLALMAGCRHAIVANSSFSWWGAWLVEQPGKLVLTPAEPGWPIRPARGWIPVANGLERG